MARNDRCSFDRFIDEAFVRNQTVGKANTYSFGTIDTSRRKRKIACATTLPTYQTATLR